MPTSQPPTNTSLFAGGLGLWVTQMSSDANATPSMLGRVVFDNPNAPDDYDIGFPEYQMAQVLRDIGGGPIVHTFLHANKAEIVLRVPLQANIDPHNVTHVVQFDLSNYTATGKAFGAGKILIPAIGPTEEFVFAISSPQPGDNLAIDLHMGDGPTTPTGTPVITGATMGFEAADLNNAEWTGFVIFPVNDDDADRFHILAGLQRPNRTRLGDLSKTVVYLISVEITALNTFVFENIQIADTDVPFTPHQEDQGSFLDSSGGSGAQSMFWVVGRTDPEHDSPVIPVGNYFDGAAAHDAVSRMSNSGGVGVWACLPDDNFLVWRKVIASSVGVSHSPIHHTEPTARPSGVPDRSVGCAYVGASQRLLLPSIDTDSGQDPVSERADKIISPPLPP